MVHPVSLRTSSATDDSPFERVLTGVPPATAAAIRAWLMRAGRVDLFGPDPRFNRFRFSLETLLPAFIARMDDLRRGTPDAILCVLDSEQDLGLDAVEARALIDTWAHVDFVHQIKQDDGVRVIVGATFRDEYVGVAFTIDDTCFEKGQAAAAATLESLESAGVGPLVLFIKPRHATRLAAGTELARRIGSLIGRGTSLGVVIPVNRLFGFAGTPRHVSKVRRYATAAKHIVVKYDAPPGQLRDAAAIKAGIRRAGARFDASMASGDAIDDQNVARWSAYLRAGAYVPQSFDLRTPAADWSDEDGIVELIRVPYGDGLWQTWESIRRSPLRRLERLLDYFRIESYFRRITDLGFAQRYHEFRVYNWGSGDPNPRTFFLDCGPLSAFDDAAGLIRDCRRLSAHLGRRWHSDPGRFVEAAQAEARARTVGRSADALQLQHDEHEYLATVDAAAPLRADVADFAAMMPLSLGTTLELGAGFGQLASHLRGRTTKYVALDLQPQMLAAVSVAAQAQGVIGDFHKLPFGDGVFDSVVANNVLEHAYDPLAALLEIRRTLTRGGTLYALIPLDGLNPAHQLPAHLWKTDLPGVRWAMKAAGFDIEGADAIDLYTMAVPASFPSCNGLVCRLRARRPWSY